MTNIPISFLQHIFTYVKSNFLYDSQQAQRNPVPHGKSIIISLWNRKETGFVKLVQDISYILLIKCNIKCSAM